MAEESAGKQYRKKLVESFIEIECASSDDFLKIRETLTRIGVPSEADPKIIQQTCHILHKQGKYYIVHFKDLFALDGKFVELDKTDNARKQNIAGLLESWGMFKIIANAAPCAKVPFTVIKHADKCNWILEPVYQMTCSRARGHDDANR